jgi:hypothetical protein
MLPPGGGQTAGSETEPESCSARDAPSRPFPSPVDGKTAGSEAVPEPRQTAGSEAELKSSTARDKPTSASVADAGREAAQAGLVAKTSDRMTAAAAGVRGGPRPLEPPFAKPKHDPVRRAGAATAAATTNEAAAGGCHVSFPKQASVEARLHGAGWGGAGAVIAVATTNEAGADGTARCASQVLDRGTQAHACGAAQVIGRGAQADACGAMT